MLAEQRSVWCEDVGTGVWHTFRELCPALHVDTQNSYLGSYKIVVYWKSGSVGLVVQIVDREQELMSTAGLQSLGGGAGLG